MKGLIKHVFEQVMIPVNLALAAVSESVLSQRCTSLIDDNWRAGCAALLATAELLEEALAPTRMQNLSMAKGLRRQCKCFESHYKTRAKMAANPCDSKPQCLGKEHSGDI